MSCEGLRHHFFFFRIFFLELLLHLDEKLLDALVTRLLVAVEADLVEAVLDNFQHVGAERDFVGRLGAT